MNWGLLKSLFTDCGCDQHKLHSVFPQSNSTQEVQVSGFEGTLAVSAGWVSGTDKKIVGQKLGIVLNVGCSFYTCYKWTQSLFSAFPVKLCCRSAHFGENMRTHTGGHFVELSCLLKRANTKRALFLDWRTVGAFMLLWHKHTDWVLHRSVNNRIMVWGLWSHLLYCLYDIFRNINKTLSCDRGSVIWEDKT